jgi:uncharacterized protein
MSGADANRRAAHRLLAPAQLSSGSDEFGRRRVHATVRRDLKGTVQLRSGPCLTRQQCNLSSAGEDVDSTRVPASSAHGGAQCRTRRLRRPHGPWGAPMTRPLPSRSSVGRRHSLFAAVLVAILPVWNNVVIPQMSGSTVSYVGVNGVAAGVLLATGRWTGLTWAELGLSRQRLLAGLRWGGACFAVVALALAAAVAIAAVRPALTDARAADVSAGDVAVEVLVRIPLGTVLWEEVAFRGVLLAALARVMPVRRAVVVASIVFGVWHIRPTLSGLAANDAIGATWVTIFAVLGVCAFTAAAGALLCWLRLRSGSLLAPVLLHLATNTLGTVAAVAAHRLD